MQFSDVIRGLTNVQASSLSAMPDLNPELKQVAPVDQAIAHTLSYIEGPKFAPQVLTTKASALI
ncbi:MAG: UDP-3-O-(3-hydroxymyristoyl)glucosamine N-acyltransferase, partial [Symploca sp. SIO2B6]|nr:UDP-3-O-(3-hydroxymyristoyl)glucosamine N-acyltransferase [Symploca sp. SIO2B6]